MTCNGRISFKDLKDTVIQLQANKKHFNELVDSTNLKLCNCFPKSPSQNLSSIQGNIANESQILPKIIGKSGSYDGFVIAQQKRKLTQHFYSHDCIQSQTFSNGESSDTII